MLQAPAVRLQADTADRPALVARAGLEVFDQEESLEDLADLAGVLGVPLAILADRGPLAALAAVKELLGQQHQLDRPLRVAGGVHGHSLFLSKKPGLLWRASRSGLSARTCRVVAARSESPIVSPARSRYCAENERPPRRAPDRQVSSPTPPAFRRSARVSGTQRVAAVPPTARSPPLRHPRSAPHNPNNEPQQGSGQ